MFSDDGCIVDMTNEIYMEFSLLLLLMSRVRFID